MQVAEVAGMLKREDAPAAVFFPLVGAGCPREENPDLPAGIGFSNDVVLRSNAHTTFHGLEKDIQVLSLSSQAFQFQVERRPALPTKPYAPPLSGSFFLGSEIAHKCPSGFNALTVSLPPGRRCSIWTSRLLPPNRCASEQHWAWLRSSVLTVGPARAHSPSAGGLGLAGGGMQGDRRGRQESRRWPPTTDEQPFQPLDEVPSPRTLSADSMAHVGQSRGIRTAPRSRGDSRLVGPSIWASP